MRNESFNAGANGSEPLFNGIALQGDGGFTRSVDARLSGRRADGSVPGSYDMPTMESLMHYHDLPQIGAATGEMVMAGEVVRG